MKHANCLRYTAAFLLVGLAAAAQQTLTTNPESVAFNTQDQAVLVEALRDGQPVRIDLVRGYQFLVGTNTYEYMISVAAEDGKLRIKPTDQLEVGSYLFTADTNAGKIAMNVYAPLAKMPDSLEARAALAGVTTEEMKALLGLSTANPREVVELGLPPLYYEGQTLTLPMAPHPGRHYTWTVNGKVAREGADGHDLAYTFREPGEYVVTYVEREGGTVVASAVASTRVIPLPPLAVDVKPGSDVVLQAPDGYRRYAWTSNGKTIGAGRELRYRFSDPGLYDIEVRGEDPVAGPADQFSRTRYRVNVK